MLLFKILFSCLFIYQSQSTLYLHKGNCAVCESTGMCGWCLECYKGFYGGKCCGCFRCDGCKRDPDFNADCSCRLGCIPGRYGEHCEGKCEGQCQRCDRNNRSICYDLCSKKSKDKKCDPNIGACYGCEKGYKGQYCTECSETDYYMNDDRECIPCVGCTRGKNFNPHGCQCNDGCMKTRWGRYCEKICESNCGYCDRKNGSKCYDSCNKTCKHHICDTDTGVCLHGCHDGYAGKYCTDCSLHYYKNNSCCFHCDGCKHGHTYNPFGCVFLDGCLETRWGKYCENTCDNNCLKCNISNGSLCYDNKMYDACSKRCKNQTCDTTSQKCLEGCEEGYEGPLCIGDTKPLNNIIIYACGGAVIFILFSLIITLCGCCLRQKRKLAEYEKNPEYSKERNRYLNPVNNDNHIYERSL